MVKLWTYYTSTCIYKIYQMWNSANVTHMKIFKCNPYKHYRKYKIYNVGHDEESWQDWFDQDQQFNIARQYYISSLHAMQNHPERKRIYKLPKSTWKCCLSQLLQVDFGSVRNHVRNSGEASHGKQDWSK